MSQSPAVTIPPPGMEMVVPAYALFAVLSMGVNLGVQHVALAVLPMAPLPFAMACGTGAGFATKYLFDKYVIFRDRSSDRRDEARKVVLYGVFGVFTTALFWASEAGLFALVGTCAARNAGAALGLVLGYTLKFILDRRYTFTGCGPTALAPDEGGRAEMGARPSRRARQAGIRRPRRHEIRWGSGEPDGSQRRRLSADVAPDLQAAARSACGFSPSSRQIA